MQPHFCSQRQPINEEDDKPGNRSDSDFATTAGQQEIACQHILPNHCRLLSMEEADNQDKEAYEQELAAGLQDRDKDSHGVNNIDNINEDNEEDEEDNAASYRSKGKQKDTNTSGPILNNIKEDAFAAYANFQNTIDSLTAKARKTPQTLYNLIGLGSKPVCQAVSLWSVYQA
ncbi:hypothetical protein C0991_006202 [Blastosporella zonata]|nr:hypothetical protein C0991_006202 [Blastosporella zonata]